MVFELWTKKKTPIHLPEVESIFPAMFGNVIHESQNAVWRLALRRIMKIAVIN